MARWQGKLIDSTGAQGTVDLDVKDGDNVARWEVRLVGRDEEGAPVEGNFTLEGRLGESDVHAKGAEKLPDGSEVIWELSLTPGPAGNYAEAAVTGTYVVRAESEKYPAPLGHGVLVLWQFQG